MRRKQTSVSPLRRVLAFVNETRWIAWALPLIGVVIVAVTYRNVIGPNRPELRVTEAYSYKTPSTPADTTWVAKYQNVGQKAATSIIAKLATIDLATKKTRLLAPPEKLARLSAEPDFRSAVAEFKIDQKDVFGLFAICLSYKDDRGETLEPTFNLYRKLPIPMSSSDGRCCELADGTTAEHAAMSSWFSCAKL
jgi:hypothetical protein